MLATPGMAADPLGLEMLSKIGAMKRFADVHHPTHPLSKNGHMRHSFLQRRLASLPYSPPCAKARSAARRSSLHKTFNAAMAPPPPVESTSAAHTTSTALPATERQPATSGAQPQPELADVAALLGGGGLPVPGQTHQALLAYVQQQAFGNSREASLLAECLHESQRVNAKFAAESSAIQAEIKELRGTLYARVQRAGIDIHALARSVADLIVHS